MLSLDHIRALKTFLLRASLTGTEVAIWQQCQTGLSNIEAAMTADPPPPPIEVPAGVTVGDAEPIQEP